MEQSSGDIIYIVTGTIFNFDTNRPKRVSRLITIEVEVAKKRFDRLYSGTLWYVDKVCWKIIKRK